MMKNIVAINTSPQTGWHTSNLVREAARGAGESGAKVEYIDLYRLGRFMGCTSCLGCRDERSGICVSDDALKPVLSKIKSADGLIIGTTGYLGYATAGFHALYERIIYPAQENGEKNEKQVLFIMSGAESENSAENYRASIEKNIGPARAVAAGNGRDDYADAKAYEMGRELAEGLWS